MPSLNQIFGSILIVAGTSVGAAMLALPLSTGVLGFFPSLIVFLFSWVLLYYSALLFLEAMLWMESSTNIISLSTAILGRPGKIISWSCYLFLLYALTVAYIAGGGALFASFFGSLAFGNVLFFDQAWFGSLLIVLLICLLLWKGLGIIDLCNRSLMFVLSISLALLMMSLVPYGKFDNLLHQNWSFLPATTSLVVTSFGFHIVIPSLITYLKRDVGSLLTVLGVGSAIPLILYALWNYLLLGAISIDGEHGLLAAYKSNISIVELISTLDERSVLIKWSVIIFSLAAILTSFLGVGLSLFDFLSDGFRLQKIEMNKLAIFVICFVPSYCVATYDPSIFMLGLEYAGAFGVLTLLVMLPVSLVWVGRYRLQLEGPYKAPGGKIMLGLAMGLAMTLIALEFVHRLML